MHNPPFHKKMHNSFIVLFLALNLLPLSLYPRGNVAVISISGEIGVCMNPTILLETACNDASIQAVLLLIESGGGVSSSSYSIVKKIEECKKRKPVITLTSQLCLSAAYEIACSTDHIIASAASNIGAIGIVITVEEPNSDIFYVQSVPFVERFNKDRMMSLIADDYDDFKLHVKKNRPDLTSDSTIWAEGRIFTGREALKVKLIDEVGSFSQAKDALVRKLNERGLTLSTKDLRFITFKDTSSCSTGAS